MYITCNGLLPSLEHLIQGEGATGSHQVLHCLCKHVLVSLSIDRQTNTCCQRLRLMRQSCSSWGSGWAAEAQLLQAETSGRLCLCCCVLADMHTVCPAVWDPRCQRARLVQSAFWCLDQQTVLNYKHTWCHEWGIYHPVHICCASL